MRENEGRVRGKPERCAKMKVERAEILEMRENERQVRKNPELRINDENHEQQITQKTTRHKKAGAKTRPAPISYLQNLHIVFS
ncbi:hypothetical protein J2S05_000194 [Alkalicoccobacillus murimartini]|uniref:Uncharacterized protein n=1 Tax=Alkalicoccobacillus murimartini TaxID=171685 RepID=A0ABT9YC43_9BACI|nr:hypothetical protein [Alkalicoccobacillus murimartini]